MMELSHATVGAVVGQKIGDPYITFVLSVVVHMVIDKIPHFWPSAKKIKVVYVIFGYLLTFLFLGYIWISSFQNKTAILVGAISGVMVDAFIIGIAPIRRSVVGK